MFTEAATLKASTGDAVQLLLFLPEGFETSEHIPSTTVLAQEARNGHAAKATLCAAGRTSVDAAAAAANEARDRTYHEAQFEWWSKVAMFVWLAFQTMSVFCSTERIRLPTPFAPILKASATITDFSEVMQCAQMLDYYQEIGRAHV